MARERRRKLWARMAALLALSAAGPGCQSLPFGQASGERVVHTTVAPPVVAETPAGGLPVAPISVEVSMAGATVQTSWRAAQRAGEAQEVVSGEWRPAQRNETTANLTAASGWQKLPARNEAAGPPLSVEVVPFTTTNEPPLASQTPAAPEPPTLAPPRLLAPDAAKSTAVVAAAPVHLDTHGQGAPRELAKAAMPAYVIEPPDILLIESLKFLPEQPIRGPHVVRPDGTVGLGIHGSARVVGLTLDQAKQEIARVILSNLDPQKVKLKDILEGLNVDVLSYNSKFYYVIFDGGGYGEQVYRVPFSGSDTVLDAIAQVGGLPAVASKRHVWVARRTPGAGGNVLPVDWQSITQGGGTTTNYQVLPGDRIYVRAEKLVKIDSGVAKVLSPIERIFGATLLGAETVNTIRSGRSINNP